MCAPVRSSPSSVSALIADAEFRSATPPPGTMPSSRAARVACSASSTRCFFSFVAVVKVGAATETEMKEKKHRVEDALQATRAALEEGIVPGGGIALLAATESIKLDAYEDDERTGAKIVLR